jgi:ABC-type oligopeptide transport system substrate-binding subunit
MGEEFSLQVLARVTGEAETNLARLLGDELSRRHQLVQELGSRQIGSQRDYLFRIRHTLFQQHLYRQVGEAERRLLHGEIGRALEEFYSGHINEITVQLAHHFTEAGEADKAIEYMLLAGDQARLLYAHQDAIGYYQPALELLKMRGDYTQTARTLMKLGLTYLIASEPSQAQQAYQEGFSLWQRVSFIQPDKDHLPASQALRAYLCFPYTLNLDPARPMDTFSALFVEHLFSGLAQETPETDVIPDVAHSWELQDGGRTYIFHLRQDVLWSDGTPVTAGDYEYAWRRALQPEISPYYSLFADIQGVRSYHLGEHSDPGRIGVETIDNHTLLVKLERPVTYFPYLLTIAAFRPVPRHIVESYGKHWIDLEHLVTNGPFSIEIWEKDRLIVLVRNPRYHGIFSGNLQRVIWHIMGGDQDEAIRLYASGKLDFIFTSLLSHQRKRSVLQRFAGDIRSIPWLRTLYLVIDPSQSPFDDRRVRQAFAMVINREQLSQTTFGEGAPATGGFVPPGMPGHSPGIGLPYDPERARQLLAQAGYPGGRDFPERSAIQAIGFEELRYAYQLLSAQWREALGIDITWNILPDSLVHEIDEKNIADDDDLQPHLYLPLGFIADYPDPDIFLRVGTSINAPRWYHPDYQEYIFRAQNEINQDERLRLYRAADNLLIQEAVIIPLLYYREDFLVKPWIHYPLSATKLAFYKDVVIEPGAED